MPSDPLLRVLALYGILAFVVLAVLPVLIQVMRLPAWVGTVAVSFAILGAPVVAMGVWLAERRR
jgi:hypothetical protein